MRNLINERNIAWAYVFTYFFRLAEAAQGCKPRGIGTEGFEMSLYHYGNRLTPDENGNCWTSDYLEPGYMNGGGYVTYQGGFIGSSSGITNLDFNYRTNDVCKANEGILPENFHYEKSITLTNFTMLLTGYFYAETSGIYKFNLEADDLAYLSFGAGNAFDCCGMKDSVTDPGNFDLIVLWNSESHSGEQNFFLDAGVYYPIRLLYANRDSSGLLSLTYTDPMGDEHSDFNEHVYQFSDEKGGCANEVRYSTTSWSGTYTTTYSTTTYTSTGTDGYGTIETIYYIRTPVSSSSIDTTRSSSDSSASITSSSSEI
ncbi:hypothetical protein C6P45_003212, partial [Maudiozyma exigua]